MSPGPWRPYWRLAAVVLVGCYDAFALWFARKEITPVLLSSKEKLRGCEGQSIQIPLALAGVQHIKALQTTLENYVYSDGRYTLALPHDGMEPMRRMVRWE